MVKRVPFIQKGRPCSGERVYAGHVSCPDFLNNPDWITEIRIPLTVVFPPVSQNRMEAAKKLADSLDDGRPGLEFSVNDWGMLRYLREQHPAVPIAAGPLLLAQDTDPSIYGYYRKIPGKRPVWAAGERAELEWTPPSDACTEHWSEPSSFSCWEFLMRQGISRLEICRQPVMPETVPPVPVSVYDRSLLSVFPCRDCRECADIPEPFRAGKRLNHDRNLIWYEDRRDLTLQADRLIVWEAGD